jgi:glucosylceramidase
VGGAVPALPGAASCALSTLFGPDGCNFSLCRTPLGADDFSRGWYSYDETPGDFALDHFSVANDRETLIPFIKAAQGLNPDLKLWASPWSPPTWMKKGGHYAQAPAWPGAASNGIRPDQLGHEGQDSFIQEERYFEAYARYFARYVDAYAKEGITISTVMPQNEFNSAQPFPPAAGRRRGWRGSFPIWRARSGRWASRCSLARWSGECRSGLGRDGRSGRRRRGQGAGRAMGGQERAARDPQPFPRHRHLGQRAGMRHRHQ